MCGRSLGSLLEVPSSQFSSPLLNRGEARVLFVPQERPSVSPDSELLAVMRMARCLVCDSRMGRSLFPAEADTRTATCRPLGCIGVRADAPTLVYMPLSSKPVRNPYCDGAYPRRERRGSAPVPPIMVSTVGERETNDDHGHRRVIGPANSLRSRPTILARSLLETRQRRLR